MKPLLCLLAALFVASAIAEPIRQETNPLDVPAADSNQDVTKLVLDDKPEEKDDNEISDEEQELDDLPEDAEEEAEQDDLPESDAEEEAEQDELPESSSDAEEEDENEQDELPESDDEPKADLSELASAAEDSNDPDANEEDPRLHRPRCYNVLRSCGRRQCKAISRPKCSRHCNRRPLGPCRSVKKNCKAPRRLKNGITIATCRVEKTCRYALRNTCYRRCIQPFTCTTCHRRHRICRCRPGYFRRGRFCIRRRCRPGYFRRGRFCIRRRCRPGYFRRGRFCIRRRCRPGYFRRGRFCIRRRCRPGYFRRRGFCVRRCHRPGSRYWNGRRCVSCRNRWLYRSYHGICIRRCRPGYFRRGRLCIRRRG